MEREKAAHAKEEQAKHERKQWQQKKIALADNNTNNAFILNVGRRRVLTVTQAVDTK